MSLGPSEPPGVFAKGGNGGGGGGGGGGGSGYAVLVLEPPPGYTVVRPAAINANREVVGMSLFYPKGSSSYTSRQAFFWSYASGSLSVQPLSAPGSVASAVNSAGDVGGTDAASGGAVIWDRSGGTWTMRVLPAVPGSSGGGVLGLNDAGEAVGYVLGVGGGPVFWDADGSVSVLPIPPPYDTDEGAGAGGRAISASGHVVGLADSFTRTSVAVFWARTATGHEPILLSSLLDGRHAEAYAVSEGADGLVRVAGFGGGEDGLYALRWTLAFNAESSGWEEIGREQLGAADGFPQGRGHGINAAGDVAGNYSLAQLLQGRAILWRASGSVESLPQIKSSRSVEEAFAVNDERWVIGTSASSAVSGGLPRGVVWKPEG